jgi:uncharacterized protein with GYD domain
MAEGMTSRRQSVRSTRNSNLLGTSASIPLQGRNVMSRVTALILTTVLLVSTGLAPPAGEAAAQPADATLHRYLVRAVLTAEGLKNLQKQPPTALKAGVAKFVESVGGKLEFWFFDYGAATAYSVIDYPDEIAAATAQLSTNAAGFARVTIRPRLSAEELDKAVAKMPPVRVPQQQ